MSDGLHFLHLASLVAGGQWDHEALAADLERGLEAAGIKPGGQDPRENALRHILRQGMSDRLLGYDDEGRLVCAASYHQAGGRIAIEMAGSVRPGGGEALLAELGRRFPGADLRAKPVAGSRGFWKKMGFGPSPTSAGWEKPGEAGPERGIPGQGA